ncbi:dynamin family protein [Paenibacillus sp. CN-4]|uniref:dynamin family protein n=1 Tax=Paenibacillus nanchangensis TaxID=3348343 RepID=UPI00397B7E78
MQAEHAGIDTAAVPGGTAAGSLEQLKKRMEQWGDPDAAEIYADLSDKASRDELVIAFCGHFSAGKSSMINRLCGANVLPSGPVPTSANVVSVRSGEPRVLVHPASREAEPWETTLEKLHDFGRNGGDYAALEVWADIPLLGSHGVLMDTPGVDSTDDGHRAATRSALHLADVVFYVMDYNHVQSENNLAFAKSLSDWGKPLYLIVNQIDKHRENELSIEVYRTQMESAFQEWGVRYQGLLFTSLKVQDHPLNGWQRLTGLLQQLIARRAELVRYSILRSAVQTAEAHLGAYREEQAEEREKLEQVLAEAGPEAAAELDRLTQERASLGQLPETALNRLRSEADALLENVNLMPADVREAAGSYIASTAPGFRTGLFSTASKREKERAARLETFQRLLARETEARLEWHAVQLLRGWAEELELPADEAEALLKPALPQVTAEGLAASVKPDTGDSGEPLLNYCRGLAAEIKNGFRRALLAVGDSLLAQLPPKLEAKRAELDGRLGGLAEAAEARERLSALKAAEAARAAELAALLPASAAEAQEADVGRLLPPLPLAGEEAGSEAPLKAAPAQETAAAGARVQGAGPVERAASQPAAAGTAAHQVPGAPAAAAFPAAGGRRRLSAAAGRLREAAAALEPAPGLASAAHALRSRADGLAGGRFTVALFGGFSAGKSSFANALLGEAALPVSPHPATAAVCRILAPADGAQNRTAAVAMKSAEEIWDDIRHAFGALQLGEPERSSWRMAAGSLKTAQLHPSVQAHAGFLRAAAAGWEEAEPILGRTLTVDMERFGELAARESLSCYVRGINLYFSCPLTDSGVVLVDTPGADSLHARHTGVTFSYMKDADAIVFVTYYNHAFSKADRQLLDQLGRIKDSFAMDKMFFVINASDLASDEEELDGVVDYVRQSLRASGLHAPRLFPLSSLGALEGKAGDEQRYHASRFGAFEAALGRFAGEELPDLSLHAAASALAGIRSRVTEWARLSAEAQTEQDNRLRQWTEDRARAEQRLAALAEDSGAKRELRREGEELLYHVRQRLEFAFGRFYQEAFHPSVLRAEASGLKERFAACGRDLWSTARRELEQELWATTLRLEAAGRRFTQKAAELAAADIGSEPHPEGIPLADEDWTAPEDLLIRLETPDLGVYWGAFKSPRHFFEGQGRTALRAELEPVYKTHFAAAAAEAGEALIAHYESCVTASLRHSAERLAEELNERDEALNASRKGGVAPAYWLEIADTLRNLEDQIRPAEAGPADVNRIQL